MQYQQSERTVNLGIEGSSRKTGHIEQHTCCENAYAIALSRFLAASSRICIFSLESWPVVQAPSWAKNQVIACVNNNQGNVLMIQTTNAFKIHKCWHLTWFPRHTLGEFQVRRFPAGPTTWSNIGTKIEWIAVGVLRPLVEKELDAFARFVAVQLVLLLTSSLDEHEHGLAHGQELPWPSKSLQPAFVRYALAPRPGVGQVLSKPSRHALLTLIRNQQANSPWVQRATYITLSCRSSQWRISLIMQFWNQTYVCKGETQKYA